MGANRLALEAPEQSSRIFRFFAAVESHVVKVAIDESAQKAELTNATIELISGGIRVGHWWEAEAAQSVWVRLDSSGELVIHFVGL